MSNTQTLIGSIAILISVGALSLSDAIIKSQGVTLPLWQLLLVRSALTLPLLLVVATLRGSLLPINLIWVAVRSVLLVVMWLCYYAALPHMPLSLAAAALYAGPIFIVVLVHLAERRWPSHRVLGAVLLGFVGVALAIGPDVSAIGPMVLLPVAAAALYAMAMVVTSTRCKGEDPVTLVLFLNMSLVVAGAGLGVFGAPIAPGAAWVAPDGPMLLILSLLAALMLIGAGGAAVAYQWGPPAIIATLDYSYLVFSVVWDLLFFAAFPTPIALTGVAMIICAGLLALASPKRQAEA
ncbi:MAG: DMT family transporter [Pseudomonadota bacterium]